MKREGTFYINCTRPGGRATRIAVRLYAAGFQKRRHADASMAAVREIQSSDVAKRKRRSRELQAAGYRVLKGGFPIDDEALSVLVESGLIPYKCTEHDLETLDAISELIDRLAVLDFEDREAIRVLMSRRDR